MATIYQVYPRSLQDTDGDGVGDLPGVTRRLLVVLDIGGAGGPLPPCASGGDVVASTRADRGRACGTASDRVHPDEGLVIAVNDS